MANLIEKTIERKAKAEVDKVFDYKMDQYINSDQPWKEGQVRLMWQESVDEVSNRLGYRILAKIW